MGARSGGVVVPEELRPEGGPVPRLRRGGAGGIGDVFHRARILRRRHRAGPCGCSLGWPVSCSVGRSVGRSVIWSVVRSVCWSVGRLVGRLVLCSVGPLVGRSVGRSVGPSIGPLVGRRARCPPSEGRGRSVLLLGLAWLPRVRGTVCLVTTLLPRLSRIFQLVQVLLLAFFLVNQGRAFALSYLQTRIIVTTTTALTYYGGS